MTLTVDPDRLFAELGRLYLENKLLREALALAQEPQPAPPPPPTGP